MEGDALTERLIVSEEPLPMLAVGPRPETTLSYAAQPSPMSSAMLW